MLKRLLLTIIVAMISTASVVEAASLPEGLSLSSDTNGEMSIIKIDVVPGKEYSFDFTVNNKHDRDAEYQLFPSDVLTKIGGDWVYRKSYSDNENAGSWYVGVDETSFTVKKDESAKHTFKIKTPDTLEPGEYISGVILSETITMEELQSLGQDTQTLAAGAKEIGLEKPIHIVLNYKVSEAASDVKSIGAIAYSDTAESERPFSDRTGLYMIDIEFDNEGYVRGKVSGKYKLTNESTNKVVVESNYSMLDIYANTVGIYRIIPNGGYLEPGNYLLEWDDPKGKHEYRFKVDPNSADKALGTLDNSNKVTINTNDNMTTVYILCSVVLLLLFIVIILLRRKKKDDKKEEQTPKEPSASL